MIHKHLVTLALLGAVAFPLSAQSVKAGIEAWQRSDYSAAVAIWRPLAEKGDADASFNLGQAYRLGRGVPTNLAAAKTWFERSAQKGHVDAQTTLGLLLFQNGDQPAGLKWLKGAAEKGEPRALLIYGTALFNGDGIQKNPVLGYAYVSRAAAQGLGPAKETLAQLDQILPLELRKKGLSIAMAKSASAPAPRSKPAGQAAKPKPPKITAAKPPKVMPPLAPTRATTLVASGGWRIQLGAFSQRGSAETLFQKLSKGAALSGRRPYYVPMGTITRLQVGPFESRATAQSACNLLKGQPCFPVPGK
jgi:TPR repeat protein